MVNNQLLMSVAIALLPWLFVGLIPINHHQMKTKTVESQGVNVAISFQSSALYYDVTNQDKKHSSDNLQDSLRMAEVPPQKVNFIVRGVKKVLGL